MLDHFPHTMPTVQAHWVLGMLWWWGPCSQTVQKSIHLRFRMLRLRASMVLVRAQSDPYLPPEERWVLDPDVDPTWRITSHREDLAVKNPLLGASDWGSQPFSPASLTRISPPLPSIRVFFKVDLTLSFFSLNLFLRESWPSLDLFANDFPITVQFCTLWSSRLISSCHEDAS